MIAHSYKYHQVDIGKSKEYLTLMEKVIRNLAFWLDVTSIAADIGLNVFLAMTAPGTKVQVSPAVKIGNMVSDSVIHGEIHELYKEHASKYTSSVPVVIRYVDDGGNVIEDHRGVLETTIYYTST